MSVQYKKMEETASFVKTSPYKIFDISFSDLKYDAK